MWVKGQSTTEFLWNLHGLKPVLSDVRVSGCSSKTLDVLLVDVLVLPQSHGMLPELVLVAEQKTGIQNNPYGLRSSQSAIAYTQKSLWKPKGMRGPITPS